LIAIVISTVIGQAVDLRLTRGAGDVIVDMG
jgi:hypothetical protein